MATEKNRVSAYLSDDGKKKLDANCQSAGSPILLGRQRWPLKRQLISTSAFKYLAQLWITYAEFRKTN